MKVFFPSLLSSLFSVCLWILPTPSSAEGELWILANPVAENGKTGEETFVDTVGDLAKPEAADPPFSALPTPESFHGLVESGETGFPHPDFPALNLSVPVHDLWERIRNGFSMPDLVDDRVLYYQQYYLSHPEYLRRMVERSRLYLHYIVGELEKRNMPTELALLPMVESAYNPLAHSPAQASGLWQFIPSTGRHYKLRQDWWGDERRDVLASTRAALDYLEYIYDLYGDWHLALASYNWGEGAVGRAIAKNTAKGLPADYINLSMPNETRHYVPKLQALKNIFSNFKGLAELELPFVPNEPYFYTLVTETPIDIQLAARFAGLSVEEFIALNPSHNRPVIQADSTLIIPADRMERFKENLSAHDKPLSIWKTYALRSGERLEDVAPRFGISLSDLKRANGVQGRVSLGARQTLLVPQGDKSALSLAWLPTLPTRGVLHQVKKGETLFSIARRYGMQVDELRQINHLKNNAIRPGKRLTVETGKLPATIEGLEAATSPTSPRDNAASAKGQASQPPSILAVDKSSGSQENDKNTTLATPPENPGKTPATARHIVKKGDTLFSIAKRYKINLADLKHWNHLENSSLKIGLSLALRPMN